MEMQGAKVIAADRETVWAALNDPEVLQAAIPGCTELNKLSDTELEATVTQKVGPVKATFKGAVELQNVVPGESYTIAGEGKGGVAGFAKGSADVRLADTDEGTELSYDAKAKVGGKLAQLGSRIIDGFARKMADEFFERFKDQVEKHKDDGDSDDGVVLMSGSESDHEAESKPGFFRRLFGGRSKDRDDGHNADGGGDGGGD